MFKYLNLAYAVTTKKIFEMFRIVSLLGMDVKRYLFVVKPFLEYSKHMLSSRMFCAVLYVDNFISRVRLVH